jgi:hypothetical protein
MSSDSDNEKRAGGAPPLTEHNEVESSELPVIIDKATERRLMRKLDARIVWVVMWTYLMNFMDRVNIGNARLYGLEEDLGLTGNQFQISVSILYVFPGAWVGGVASIADQTRQLRDVLYLRGSFQHDH